MSDSEALQPTGDGAPPTKRPSIEGVESALLEGDLSKLSSQQRMDYYQKVCESVGLNPLTKPFEYIRLNGQLTLYAKRDAAEQLRDLRGISITDMEETWKGDILVVRAYAKTENGRTDVATGAVDTSRSSGQDLANDIMKAETKAKRRATLSISGLGWLDETEVDDIDDSATQEVNVDYETGEIKERKPDNWYTEAANWLIGKVEEGKDASAIISNFDKVPSGHPVDDWPKEKAEALVDHLKNIQEQRDSEDESGADEDTTVGGPQADDPDEGTTRHQGDEKTDPRAHMDDKDSKPRDASEEPGVPEDDELPF